MSLTPSELGAILAILFAGFLVLKIFAKTTAVIGLLAIVLIGTSGWVGRLVGDVTGAGVRLLTSVGAAVLGAGAAAVIGVVIYLVIHYAHGLHPKHSATQAHAWIGVALGALIVAGLTGIPALNGLHTGIVNAVGTITSAL